MKTLYFTNTGQIVFDEETREVNSISSDREGINRIYLIEEPMTIVYKREEGDSYSETAEAGDIVVVFYDRDFKYPIVVAKSDKWNENLIEYRKKIQADKERWAKEKLSEPMCDACEACSNGI